MITKFWRISFIPIGKDIYIYIYIHTHTHTHSYIDTYFFPQLELNGSLLLKVVVAFFFFLNDSYGACYEAMSYLQVGFLPSFLFLSFSLSVFLFPSSFLSFFGSLPSALICSGTRTQL